MKQDSHRIHSIYMQMLILLVSAAVVAGVLFLALDKAGEYVVDRYMEESDYTEIRNRKAVYELQQYITLNQINARDEEALNKWVQKQKLVSVSIYKDGIMVFDSDYPDRQIWNAEIVPADYDWIVYDKVIFADGEAEILMTGAWLYQIYSYIRIVEIGVCFFVFLIIVLCGIRRKMRYIRQLSDEVKVLEGGGLHCPVTVRGYDELSVLAEGLDNMRISFLDSQAREEEMIRRHKKVITEMSHDLRTPITAIMLYTEILMTKKKEGETEQRAYIEKIGQKAHQLKERTDRLLDYSLKEIQDEKPELEPGSFQEVFYDPLSEVCGYLEQKGFHISLDIQWQDGQLYYNTDYIVRIMDNIASNIVKYADPQYPVLISQIKKENEIGFMFQNRIARSGEAASGTGIGIQSIRNMMQDMGGICRSESKGSGFSVIILFPVTDGKKEAEGAAQTG